jgi:hypothetical protein
MHGPCGWALSPGAAWAASLTALDAAWPGRGLVRCGTVTCTAVYTRCATKSAKRSARVEAAHVKTRASRMAKDRENHHGQQRSEQAAIKAVGCQHLEREAKERAQ